MNRVTWIIIIAVCVLGLAGLVFMTKKDAVDVSSMDPINIVKSSDQTIGDHVYGNKDAKVVLFEYADFQCGGCAGAARNTPTIKELYKDKVAFVFRNFPLTSGHPNALAAATAAEAANYQGKYWEMNSLIFTMQSEWTNLSITERGEAFVRYAKQVGLNEEQFKSDLARKEIQDKIKLDRALAAKVGVNSTPSFFINSEKVDEATTTDTIQQTGQKLMDKLDEALRKVGETPPNRSQQ